MTYDRIAIDHQVMAGAPCIKGMRIPVSTIVGMVADGISTIDIQSNFAQLTQEDIHEALHFAADAVRERGLTLRTSA